MPSACNSMHRYASRLAVLGSARRRSGSRRLSPRLGRPSPPAGGGRSSASASQGAGEGGGEGAVRSSTGPRVRPRGTQPEQGGGDAHSGAADSAAGCRPQLPSVACGAPRGAESCSSLKAPSWARHSSPPHLLRLAFQALGCARHSGSAAQPLRAECGGCGVAVSPGRCVRFGGVQPCRSWRSTRGRVVAGTVDAQGELKGESGGRAVFSPPRLILEHGGARLTVPPSLAGVARWIVSRALNSLAIWAYSMSSCAAR